MTISFPRRSEERSSSLWAYVMPWLLLIPLLVFCANGEFSFQAGARNSLGVGIAGGGAEARGEREILLLSYSIIGVLVLQRYRRVLRMSREMKAVTLLALFAVLSTIWSQKPAVSFVRSTYYVLDTLLAFWLVDRFTTRQLRMLLMMVGSIVALCSFVMVTAFPRFGLVGTLAHFGAWQGLFPEKNEAGGAFVFLLTPAIDFSRRLTRMRLLYIGVILFLLFMTQSRTAWTAAVVYPSFLLIVHWAKRVEPRLAIVSAAAALVGGVALAALIIPNLDMIFAFLGRDLTLTGRTKVWPLVLQAVGVRPVLGYGFSAFWDGLNGESGVIAASLGWSFSYAHDGVLEVLLQVGVSGMLLLAYILQKAIREAWYCFRWSDDPEVTWFIGIIFLTLFYNFDEETLFFPHSLNTLLFLIACCGLRMAKRSASLRHGYEYGGMASSTFEERQPVFAFVSRNG